MLKKSEIEMERFKLVKVTRTLTRLKHSLQIDKELNDLLPAQLEEFDMAIQQGELKSISAGLIEDILES